MKRKEIILFGLLWLLIGCTHKTNDIDIYQRAIGYVMPLVDSGCIVDKYIHVYEHLENDSSTLYSFFGGYSPTSDLAEFPSKIIKVNDRYFCFIELDEPELSIEQINQITNCDSAAVMSRTDVSADIWFMGVSKYKNSGAVVKRSSDANYIFEYTELWPYLSGGQPEKTDFYMCSVDHDMILSDSSYLESDSLKYYIKKICGRINVKNKTDSTIVLSSDVLNRTFIIANGSDTLSLSLRDSLPIEIPANGFEVFSYESSENSSFYQKLPCKNTWMSLYKILSDSTFSFLKINGKAKTIRLLHEDSPTHYIRNDSGEILKKFRNKGVFDKEKRNSRFIGTLLYS